jgi:signal peptidase I
VIIMRTIFKKIGSFFMDLVEAGVMALAIFVLVYLFLFQPHQVLGNSMLPNFHDHENLLTNKISYRFSAPKRGDVVIFKAPANPNYEYIKRIVGLPGEIVKIENGGVSINDIPLEESYLPPEDITYGGRLVKEHQEIIVADNSYFVMGDNRSHSSDSREWGLVPKENIIGKAMLRYWPPEKFGVIHAAEY